MVLKKLDLMKDAVEILTESLRMEPMHWGTWQELVPLVTDRDVVHCSNFVEKFLTSQTRFVERNHVL